MKADVNPSYQAHVCDHRHTESTPPAAMPGATGVPPCCRAPPCATSARTSRSHFGYNALGIPVAAGVLYPAFDCYCRRFFAGAAMAFSAVSVVTNALRLNRVKL